MNRYLLSFLVFTTLLFSQENLVNTQETIDINQSYDPNVDCLILEDENSIICKFEVIRDTEKEQIITINWVSPTGEISRSREMIIPPGDSSAYDYRYLDGREGGKWDFMIIYNGKEYSSKFELKN